MMMRSKSMGRDGQRRRSPRISALDACKQNHRQACVSRTRTCRIKRKFDEDQTVSKLAKQVWKGRDGTDCVDWRSGREENQKRHHYDGDGDDDDATTNGKASTMPAKHTLELVLDTLQRRDTNEIFAEPVDPDEVEDYYEIIKEPMDFGTMRAKLHEGMYKNLEEFEHDVFLIPENAMHFNSSATVYFRQARAIHELAKKVFHVLKTDPENFVLEFAGTRRRSMRKALSESGVKSGDISAKGTSTVRRSGKKSTGCAPFFSRNVTTGSRDGGALSSRAADRRFTYGARDGDSTNSMSSAASKPLLLLMNQGETSYRNSLTSFVKDLGPTAQMVARRKLLGEHERPQLSAATQRKEGNEFRGVTPGSHDHRDVFIDLTQDEDEAKGRKMRQAGKDKIDGRDRKSNRVAGGGRRGFRGADGDTVRPVILALENFHSSNGEYKLRNKKSCPAPAAPPRTNSRFAFDLSFLKERLSQMSSAQLLKRPPSVSEKVGVEAERALHCTRQADSIGFKPFLCNQSRPSFHKLDNNSALQL